MERHRAALGGSFTPEIMIAVVRRHAPDALRSHLQLAAVEYQGDYQCFHDKVEAYFHARGAIEEAENHGDMEVGALSRGGTDHCDQLVRCLDHLATRVKSPGIALSIGCHEF